MAAQIFPNTIFVEECPGVLSRQAALNIFGGSIGHINLLEFINNYGKPKVAFIVYDNARSLPLALELNGTYLDGQPPALKVKVIDERVLCNYIPRQGHDVEELLVKLQQVLFLNLALMDELKRSHEQYRMQKRREEQDKDHNLFLANAHIKAVTERCAMLEAENRGLEKRVKEAVELGRESCSNLKIASLRCTQLQTEIDAQRTKLTQVTSEPKVERGRDDSESKQAEGKAEEMRRALEETTAQKERAIEKLGIANNTVLNLREELKMTQKAAEVSQSSLRWAKSALGDMDSRVSAMNAYVTQIPDKRQKAGEDLMDERTAKRPRIEEHQASESCGTRSYEAEKYETELRELEKRLGLERQQRKEAEASLAEANAKLERVVLTDSMIAVFVKFDHLLAQVAEEMSLSNQPSD